MTPQLTPGAERALAYAAQWWRGSAPAGADSNSVGAAELLMGLLAEPECRAALLATNRGVDSSAVRARWPELQPAPPEFHARNDQLSAEVLEALHAAEDHLVDFPPPHELATEHLLLGLTTGRNEVAQWLASRGWDAAQLAAEIDRLVDHASGPLPLEWDSPAGDATTGSMPSSATRVHTKHASHESAIGHEMSVEELTTGVVDHEQIAQLRIVDAAANRAGEAVRVIEDYARFALDDRHLAGECKTLRHGLATALSVFPTAQRHAARETRRDVGTTLTVDSETQRADLRSVVAANFKRFQQALRSLEEYAKPTSITAAAALEGLRYRAYTLERAIDITAGCRQRLSACRLYVLVDGRESLDALARLVETLIAAGTEAIQLRDKCLPDRELLARARAIGSLTRGTQTLFIVNDRPDIARLAGADGVHVGQDELGVKEARTIVGPEALVGVSTHSLEQACEAVIDGANYIGVGPVFASQTKQFSQFPGLELLRQVSAEIRLPAFAIGGITVENIAEVRAAGFDRVAVSGAVTGSADPADAVRALKSRLT